jgi:Zn-dependent peptidase ImmA (M78 family)
VPAYRRGFKSEAAEIAGAIRTELGLTDTERLVPGDLADHLGIPVLDIGEFGELPDVVHQLTQIDTAALSALTVLRGTARLIVVNHAHSIGRIANSVAHEISHVLLEHDPGVAVTTEGFRTWHAEQEAEADWLAGCLLIPRGGLLEKMATGMSLEDLASHFGVSLELARWRDNMTGVTRQLQRRQR